MMDRTLPRNDTAPFDIGLGDPMVHLLLFVHRVTDIPGGLYFLVRNQDHSAEIRALSRSEFLWEPTAPGIPLYRLKKGDYRHTAAEVSCHQDIAGASAFSLGMIARFADPVRRAPYRYRHLYWECGMIGQVLYLEAEAMGVRGTGIGCFFDDPVHDILGLPDHTYQSLYHFTVGVPVEDPRLTTHPPYDHLKRAPK
jgi:nitroreductase